MEASGSNNGSDIENQITQNNRAGLLRTEEHLSSVVSLAAELQTASESNSSTRTVHQELDEIGYHDWEAAPSSASLWAILELRNQNPCCDESRLTNVGLADAGERYLLECIEPTVKISVFQSAHGARLKL